MRLSSVLLVLAVLATALVPVAVSAQAVDDFAYVPATNLGGQNGGSGWAGPWGSSSPFSPAFTITSGGLTFPGLITSGNAVRTNYSGSSWAYINRFTSAAYGAPNSSTWVQFLVRPDTGFGQWGSMVLGGAYWATNSVTVGLNSDNTGTYLYIQQGPNPPIRTPFAYSAGNTYLVQAKFDIDGTGSLVDVKAYAWVNNIMPTASVTANGLNWSGVGNSLQLYSSGDYTYDQFHVGDTPDDPVPEAGTMVALGSFLSMGGVFLRRRFSKS